MEEPYHRHWPALAVTAVLHTPADGAFPDGGGADREALRHLTHGQEPAGVAGPAREGWSAGGPAFGTRNDKGRIR